jgi:hypothetical protein
MNRAAYVRPSPIFCEKIKLWALWVNKWLRLLG